MRQTFQNANFDHLAECWQASFPEKYWVDADLLRTHTVDCPTFDWGASFILQTPLGVEGFVVVKSSPAKLYKGPDQDQSHLSAIVSSEPTLLVEMFSDVKNVLRNRGTSKVVFGQDTRHFFPGVPLELNVLHNFLKVEGFRRGSEVVDLQADLQTDLIERPLVDGFEYRLMVEKDRPALQHFFLENFPGRWHFDVGLKVEIEGPSCVFLALRDGQVEGFALLHRPGAHLRIGGAVWSHSLGESWGSLGPIGVSKNVRGQGLGGALLGAALQSLKREGIRQCIIDWTTLVEFYGKWGFKVARQYETYHLPMD